MEYFDVIDENGMPTGQTVERNEAHRNAIPHRTSHVWLARRRDGAVQILLQKRCLTKDSYPGCYDISSAGHIPAGADFVPSALRELKEELGLDILAEDLIECGTRKVAVDDVFYGEPFHDRQFSKVFLLWLDKDENEFVIQKEEIDSVLWMDFYQCKKAVEEHTIPNCIDMEELLMLEKLF